MAMITKFTLGGSNSQGLTGKIKNVRYYNRVLEKEEIAKYFPEMLRLADNCKFIPCTHTHEPDCAVKAAVETGEIAPERYNSYLGMLEEDSKFRK